MFPGQFVWAESHKEAVYTNWAVNQPGTLNADLWDCVLKANHRDIGWHDYNCDAADNSAWSSPIHALCKIESM